METTQQAVTRILSLDTSLCNTGFVLFEVDPASGWKPVKWGVLHTAAESKKRNIYKGDDMTRRIMMITEALVALMRTNGVRGVCAEATSGGSISKSAAVGLAVAKTLVVALTTVLDLPLLEVSPDDVKQALCGNKGASKLEVQAEVTKRYPVIADDHRTTKAKSGFTGEYEHVADAVSVFHAVHNTPLIRMLTPRKADNPEGLTLL